MKSRQDTSVSPLHEVSTILQTLLKEGALRTNIPKLLGFNGERAKGEVSFEQWSYELQTLQKTYRDSALREGIQHSLTGAEADTVQNMGPDVPLDTIIKKFTIVYGNVKSFDLLVHDFYCTDQSEDGSIPSFATPIEGLLSQIWDKFPDTLPHQEEQRLLWIICSKGVRRASGIVLNFVFLTPALTICIFLNAERLRKSEK